MPRAYWWTDCPIVPIQSRQPSYHEIMDCLENTLNLDSRMGAAALPIYLIIDGLDEFPNDTGVVSPRERVLEQVKKLVA